MSASRIPPGWNEISEQQEFPGPELRGSYEDWPAECTRVQVHTRSEVRWKDFALAPAVEFINWKAYFSVPGTTVLILLDWQVGNCAAKTVCTVIEMAGLTVSVLGCWDVLGLLVGVLVGLSLGASRRGMEILCTSTWIR